MNLTASKKDVKAKLRRDKHIEINLEDIVTEIYELSPLQQNEAKKKYIGLTVECPTYLSKVEKSEYNKEILQLSLRYKHNRKLFINCDVKITDYEDLFWMDKGKEVYVTGDISNIGNSFISLKKVKLQFFN